MKPFVDEVKIHLKSGKGGAGCTSFASDPFKPRGGPDGGNGGRGGNVILKTNPHMNTLLHLQGIGQLQAQNGFPGLSQNRSGAGGEHLVVEVPPGTLIRNQASGELLLDMMEGESILLKGGRGGKGNTHFKTSVNQAPQHSQPGAEAEEVLASFQLKLIAHVGVIGLPNAGKSTLVSVLTAARPKIADYPFTTLKPQLGVIKFSETTTLTITDTPGLIEGAAQGVGLGHRFLRHIERTKVFLHLLDVSDFSARSVWDDFVTINQELKNYDKLFLDQEDYLPLGKRPQLVVFNKIDGATTERVDEYEQIFLDHGHQVIKISAATQKNKKELLRALSQQFFGGEINE